MKNDYSEEEKYEKQDVENNLEDDSDEVFTADEEDYQPANLMNAIFAGLFGAVVGAGLWAVVGVVFNLQMGIVSILIGVIVGHMVNRFGHGDSDLYRIIGAGFALFGCVLGKYSVIFVLISKQYNLLIIEVLELLNGEILLEITTSYFRITDLGFFLFAAFQGYKLSVQRKVDTSKNIV